MTVVDEKIAALDRGFDALEHRDLEAFSRELEPHCHPRCEFYSAIGSEMDGRVFRGWEEMRGWFADYLDTMQYPKWTDRHYEPIGDSGFMMLARFEMSGAASGVTLETELGQVYELEDGLVTRGESYTSHARARAAAERLKAGAKSDA